MALTDEGRLNIISRAPKHPEIEAVYPYGSRREEPVAPDSDLAVAMDLTTWLQ